MSFYRFFAKASKQSDLSGPSGPLSASIMIKEASDASVTIIILRYYTARKCERYQLCMLPQQAYKIKKYENLF